MFGWQIGFDRPWWLLLLLLLPLLWVFSYRSLSGLGRFRRFLALSLRTAVLLLIVFSLAEVQLMRTSEKMTVIYLLDQSASIPAAKREAMIRYVTEEVAKHRNATRQDRAGVIVFGREAKIEIPPFDDDIRSVGSIESYLELRTDATNLASALKLAQASFPEDTAKRVVVVTDGNENVGDSRSIAAMLADDSIAIDVVPVKLTTRGEIAVEKITLPPDVRKGQPIEARAVVNNYSEQPVSGKLKITRSMGRRVELLSEQDIELRPGKNVYSFPHQIDDPAAYTYQADFFPADAADDLMSENNEATAFVHVRGKGRVLLIEDWQNAGDFDYLIDRLRANNIEVTVQPTNQLFTSLAELQGFDLVILANVPRSSGDDTNSLTSFSDEQVQMLVRNTENFGCGLIMLGGPNSFGAGGWANTELEKAMPVDFQIKNAKVQAVGALVMCMHASELPEGNYWQKVISREALKALGPMDYAGVIHWGSGAEEWLWGGQQGLIKIANQRDMMLARLGRMTPGDMPAFDPSMRKALAAFNRVKASVKHMIIISDGDPTPPNSSTLSAFKKAGVKITTVAVGTHGPAGSTPLQNIATVTGGQYYVVTNPKALPRIYQREARKVTRPLIYEPDGGVQPQIIYPHELLQGIENPLPPLKGFVLTTVKENPLVEVSVLSPKPDAGPTSTILASWTYGAGRSAVFTSDAGKRWAADWTNWPNYDKFFTQLVRWAMRPVNEEGRFTVATDVKDGKVRVVITALNEDDSFRNFLDISAAAISPKLDSFDFRVQQTAPGRYVGEFDADEAGSYFLTLNPGKGGAPILAGVNVPYSAEFRDRETNVGLIESLAAIRPKGGEAGKIIGKDISPSQVDELTQVDTFRHNLPKAVSRQAVWPLFLLVATYVFFGDVLVRRVTLGWEWTRPLIAWFRTNILRRTVEEVPDQRLERLRQRKAAVTGKLDERRAATRFEPQTDAAAPPPVLDDVLGPAAGKGTDKPSAPPPSTLAPQQGEQDSYTERLLKAKQKARRDRGLNE